tara:strand:- start:1245 stop:1832 length:588 start_codon:yes stop_codon:yes gene_type:complete
MKKITDSILAAVLLLTYNISAQDYTVNTEKSKIHWIGKKVTGEHDGFIQLKQGKFSVIDDQIKKGQFTIDMNSMTCTDIEDAQYNQKLIGHLKSADFFGVEQFPKAKLVLTKSSKFKNNQCVVQGDLTIKNKTDVVKFLVKRDGQTFKATIEVDRSKYDVRYGSSSFFDNLGDKVIYDVFELDVELTLNEILNHE